MICLAATCPGGAQDAVDAAKIRALDEGLSKALSARDPVLRGEAALALAVHGDANRHREVLRVAQDEDPAARLRGIVAVGMLGVPGAEAFLGDLLLRPKHRGVDDVAAALGLGLLPPDLPAPAIDRYLASLRGGAYQREAATLSALLYGFAVHPHPERRTVLRQLIEDASNREGRVLRLAHLALARMGDVPSLEELRDGLRDDRPALRLAALEAWPAKLDTTPDDLRELVHLARRDPSDEARAAALAVLTRVRHLPALELAGEMLRSRRQVICAAAVQSILHLGGGELREELEREILAADEPELQAAMLAADTGPFSPSFVTACCKLAEDERADDAVRIASAGIAAQAGATAVVAPLRALAARVADAAQLVSVLTALSRLGAVRPVLEEFGRTPSHRDPAALPGRVLALARIDGIAAAALLVRFLGEEERDGPALAAMIRSYRLGRAGGQADALAGDLPPPVADLLR
jgi:hypothetical protein